MINRLIIAIYERLNSGRVSINLCKHIWDPNGWNKCVPIGRPLLHAAAGARSRSSGFLHKHVNRIASRRSTGVQSHCKHYVIYIKHIATADDSKELKIFADLYVVCWQVSLSKIKDSQRGALALCRFFQGPADIHWFVCGVLCRRSLFAPSFCFISLKCIWI